MASVRRGARSPATRQIRRDVDTRETHKWTVDGAGNITNFDMKTLRNDILFRLHSGQNLYTLEEARLLIIEMTRTAMRWQADELAQLQYLAELHTKVLPGRQVVYQFPPSAVPSIPFCAAHGQLNDNPLFKVTKVVEELNRSMVRMIDELWAARRERLLLAARILRDLEEAVPS